jgi:protein-tyrosine kinase
MWFRKQNRLRQETATPIGGNFEASATGELDFNTPSLFSIDDASPMDAPDTPLALRVGNRQVAQFTPKWRRVARKLVIGLGAPSNVSSTYNTLRAQIVKTLQQNNWSTVAVTSPSRGSGNTLTAINLAINLARDSKYTVILVELDLIAPSFQRILGFKQRSGVSDYLLHDAPLSEILLDVGVDRLLIVPAGAPVANSSELLSSPEMARFVGELGRRHARQIVLFDLPSVLAFDDARAFAPLIDCALLVVEEGETKVSDVRRALTRLESTKILGIALNRSIHGEDEIGTISR